MLSPVRRRIFQSSTAFRPFLAFSPHNRTLLTTSNTRPGKMESKTNSGVNEVPPPTGSQFRHFPHATHSTPGEQFEPRQTHPTGDYTPDPSKSLPLSRPRQALIEDIMALYNMKPTIERVKRYTPDCVYDDQFVYANDRYKMAGQWYALPKLFKDAPTHAYQVVTNDRDLIQFRHEQSWTFKIIPKTATINAIVSLSLDPGTVDSDFIQVKYHKDQANDKDYSHEGVGFSFKKWQADQVAKHMDSPEVEAFAADKTAGKENVKKHGSGTGDAPTKGAEPSGMTS